jgi:hypothetical protein
MNAHDLYADDEIYIGNYTITVIRRPTGPFFLAKTIASALKIRRINSKLSEFASDEVLDRAAECEHNIAIYKQDGRCKREYTARILTLKGVIRLARDHPGENSTELIEAISQYSERFARRLKSAEYID